MNNEQKTMPAAMPMTAKWLKDKLHDLHTKSSEAINEVVNEIRGHCDNPKHFTIDEFKAYITSQDSLGDVMHNLSAENIIKANQHEPAEVAA